MKNTEINPCFARCRLGLAGITLALALSALPFREARAQGIYYLRSTDNNGFQLARVNADGSGDQVINTGLPVPTFPSWSRDGALLALTSVNPQRPSKISQDVFIYNPANGAAQPVVPF